MRFSPLALLRQNAVSKQMKSEGDSNYLENKKSRNPHAMIIEVVADWEKLLIEY